ncbi:MAG: Gldg family protein [Chloroflexota bacterium]|nr:Gldg family protein [Chloroflexota bacterium]
MSEQPNEAGGDWRRQGRRGRQSRPQESDTPENESIEGEEEEELRSRTLFSFLEPSLNTIGAFGTPLVIAGIVAIVAGAILVAFVSSMRLYGYISLGFGVALLLLVGLISLSSVVAAFISRTGRYGVNSLIMLAAFLGIVLVANIVSFSTNARMDVTATNQYSLAERTEQLLNDLDDEIEVIAFYKGEVSVGPQGSASAAFQVLNREAKVEETFREFEAARPTKFASSFVDPDVNPQRVNQYFGNTPVAFVNESIVVKLKDGDTVDVIQPRDANYSHLEQDLVTSILVVTGQEQKAIYFLAGHGERSVDSAGADGYSDVRLGLEQDNYRVEPLRWIGSNDDVSVPEDAALLVVARPTNELPESHAQVLNLFLQGKNPDGSDRPSAGRLVFLADPDTPETFRQFMATWGVVIGTGYIRDLDGSLPGNPHTLRLQTVNPMELPREVISQLPRDILETLLEITTPKGQSLDVVLMPGAASLQSFDDGTGLRQPVPLAFSSLNSYVIQDSERTEPRTDLENDPDPRGPFSPVTFVRALGPVGAAPPTNPASIAENDIASMVVMGDSDFVSNSFYDRGSGKDLFLNSVNYLVGDHSLVSLRPKALAIREFNVDRNQENFVKFSSWLLLPGLMGLMAGLVWWIRR